MRLLLDTHVLLWWLLESPKLSPEALAILADPENDVLVSAVTHAEISVKRSLGKLESPWIPDALLSDNGFDALPFTADHGRRMLDLPFHHRDPFDRMLVAQAAVENLPLMTADVHIRAYDIRILDAA